MTIGTTTRVAGPFVGDGGVVNLDFTFKVFDDSEVQVLSRLDSTGVDTELVLGANYTVLLNPDQDTAPGGRVILAAALATGRTAFIVSQVSPLQETAFTNSGGFYPTVLNDSLDRLHALHLENREVNSRAVVTPVGETGNLALPPVANRVGKYLYFDVNGDITASDGTDAGTAIAAVFAGLASSASGEGAALIGGLIADSVTINVPADYSTIAAAFAYVSTKTIARGAVVTIKVADGTYTHGAGLLLNHPQGESIRLIGNQTTPANCIITVSGAPTFDALTVSNGHTLGLLDGFKFSLSSKATGANNYTAVLALNGGNIICGSKIVTDNWYYGLAARVGSSIYCRSAVVSNAGDVGIWAFIGSSIDCQSAVVSSCSDSANTLGWGIEAEYGSSIDCSSATVSGCYRGGIGSLSGSTIKAASAVSDGNTGMVGGAHGLFAENGGVIEAHSAQTINNSGFGIHLGTVGMGIVIGNSITNTGNTAGTYNTSAILDVTGGQSRLLFYGPSGARIDNANAAPIYVNTAGGAQFEFAHVASAVNHVAATGSATGSHVRLTATGTDANIDIALEAKGTGVPRFGGWTSNADAAVNGYVTIKDSSGNTRKLATIA